MAQRYSELATMAYYSTGTKLRLVTPPPNILCKNAKFVKTIISTRYKHRCYKHHSLRHSRMLSIVANNNIVMEVTFHCLENAKHFFLCFYIRVL